MVDIPRFEAGSAGVPDAAQSSFDRLTVLQYAPESNLSANTYYAAEFLGNPAVSAAAGSATGEGAALWSVGSAMGGVVSSSTAATAFTASPVRLASVLTPSTGTVL